MSQLLMQTVAEKGDGIFNINQRFTMSLENNDIQEMVDTLNSLLSSIPFDDYTNAAKQSKQYKLSIQEWLYRSMFLAFLRGMGILVFGEMHNSKGREDMVIVSYGRTLVLELKVALQGDAPEDKLEEALSQIASRDYGAEYPAASKLALVVEDSKRQISLWQET
jgi:1,2-phenylacetyl-CoA epoxidase catalytic subunit